jgi:hypothetical protein
LLVPTAKAQSAPPPAIRTLSPDSGPVGTIVTIVGSGFTSNNTIQFRGEQASFAAGSPVQSVDHTTLVFHVTTCPSYQLQCPAFFVPAGRYTVNVVNGNGTSNAAVFVLVRQ